MSVYFYVVFKAMTLSQVNLKVYDQISYLPMCGWNGGHQAGPSNIVSSPQQALPQRTMDALAYTRIGDDNSNSNSLDKHNNGNTGDDDTLNDHVDRGIGGIHYDKMYILTYMSPKTAEKRQERKGGDNKEGTSTAKVDDDAGDKTTKDQTIYTSSKKTASYSTHYFKTTQSEFEQTTRSRTGKNDRTFSSSTPGTTPKPSLFRKRRDAIAKPGSSSSSEKDKESQQPIYCSCTIKTAHNFNMSLLGVHGPRPKKLLMLIKPVVSDSGKVRTFQLNASLFWDDHYSVAPEWSQTQKMATVTVTIDETEKPVDPYMIVLGVSGSHDLKIQCKSRSTSTLEGTRNPLGIHKSTINPKTSGAPKTLKNPVTPRQEKSLDPDGVEISPFFVGAVTALAVALIVMIAGLALWKRSRTNLRKAHLNKTGGLMMGQHEDFYEEIPDPNRGRSSSKTRLGTLSLSLPRGQNSPVLNHRDMKKDSLERTAILTTVSTSTSLNMNIPTTTTTATATSTTTSTDDQTGGSMMSTSASPSDKPVYAVYEELPEIKREAHPPPKPFLDRESLMIQRSQSTPIRYSYSSCSSNDEDDGANQPEDNRRIKMSLSYSEDKSVRIDRDMGALLLKQYSFQHQTSATKTGKEMDTRPSTTKHEEPLQQNGQIIASSDEPDLDDDDNNINDDNNNNNNDRDDPNNGKSSCDCGRNDPENTYMEIDCRHCHDVTANKAKTTEVNEGGISRLRKGTVVYRPERDEEFVMFDNVIYSSCDALELASH